MTNITVRIWTRVKGVNEVAIYIYGVGGTVYTCDKENWRLEYEQILGRWGHLYCSVSDVCVWVCRGGGDREEREDLGGGG